MLRSLRLPLIAVATVLLAACSGSVTRVDPDEVIDKTGEWNDTDSRLVAEAMVEDSLDRPWAGNFIDDEGSKPVVRVAPPDVVIRTNGHLISKEIFLNDIRRAFINSGKVTVVSTRGEAGVTRSEIAEQQEFAREETRKTPKAETGADYMLHGAINVQDQYTDNEAVKFYSIDLFLTDVETREQVWAGNKKIKKVVTGAAVR